MSDLRKELEALMAQYAFADKEAGPLSHDPDREKRIDAEMLRRYPDHVRAGEWGVHPKAGSRLVFDRLREKVARDLGVKKHGRNTTTAQDAGGWCQTNSNPSLEGQ